MKIYDVSRTLHPGMEVYPGDPAFTMTPLRSGAAYLAALSLGTHTGTHIDAPAHYFPGSPGVDALPPERLVVSAELLSAGGIFSCTTDAVLYRSGTLSPEEAEEMVSCGVSLVGTDMPSIGDDEVHRTLLQAGVLILEMLDFTGVPDGIYQMVALPLKIAGADAAPARVLLMDEKL